MGHDVQPVDHDPLASRRPQGHVQHGATLGDVELLAPEHRVDPLPQPALLSQPEEQAERLARDRVLGVVEVDALRFGDQPLAAARVVREELSQLQVAHLSVVGL